MKTSNMIWGIILIIVGVIFGLNALEITDINIFFNGWWTLFIIIPCLISLLKGKEYAGNIIGLFVGVTLLLACNNIITFELIGKLLLPVILVVIGFSILFKDIINTKIKNKIKNVIPTSSDEFYAVFGSNRINPTQDEINGANVNAIFGELVCDLSNSKITKDIVINATSVFGGMTIIVPDNVNIVTSAFPLFGGITNKVKNKDNKNTIFIKGTIMFGGIDIK